MKNILYSLLIAAIAVTSCTPPEVGYISDNIHALQDTIFVPRGGFTLSAPPAVEGSTYPLHWELTGVTDPAGNANTELTDEHEILIWKQAFNGVTDTTLALAEAKLELADRPTLLISETSGELVFTQASRHVDSDLFHINVKASNVKGERQLDDFVVVKLAPFQPVEFPVEMRSRLNLTKNSGGNDILYTSSIVNSFDDGVPSVLDGTHPYITVTKISDEPAFGIKAKMIITDSHGVPLNPEKVVGYPSGAAYLPNYHENSVETITDATSSTFSLPATPFPQYSNSYDQGDTNSYLMYYLSTADAFTVDTAAWEAENGPKDWAPYTDPDTGNINNSAYIRWGIKINDSGTWELKMRIPYTNVKE